MINPKDELQKYLDRLINRYINIWCFRDQLKKIYDWVTPDSTSEKNKTLNFGAWFFRLSTYSLQNTILVELTTLLSTKKDQKSLPDWLNKAHEHAALMEPVRFNPNYPRGEYQPINFKEYRAIINSHKAQLVARKEVIDRIKKYRDKVIAHRDKKYFENTESFYMDYPLNDNEVEELMKVISNILEDHYRFLFKINMHMKVSTFWGIDTLLNLARAFIRAMNDENLIKMGFDPGKYLKD